MANSVFQFKGQKKFESNPECDLFRLFNLAWNDPKISL